MPARPRFATFVARRIEPHPGDHRVGMAAVGVDGDPAAFASQAPPLHRARRQRALEEFAAVEREADRSGAVIASVQPTTVAAALDVGLGADLVGGFDHGHDLRRGALRGNQFPGREKLRFGGRGACIYFRRGQPAGDALGGGAPGAVRAMGAKTTASTNPALNFNLSNANRSPLSAYGVSCRASAKRSLRSHLTRWISPENLVPPFPWPFGDPGLGVSVLRTGGSIEHRLGLAHKTLTFSCLSHCHPSIPVGCTAASLGS